MSTAREIHEQMNDLNNPVIRILNLVDHQFIGEIGSPAQDRLLEMITIINDQVWSNVGNRVREQACKPLTS